MAGEFAGPQFALTTLNAFFHMAQGSRLFKTSFDQCFPAVEWLQRHRHEATLNEIFAADAIAHNAPASSREFARVRCNLHDNRMCMWWRLENGYGGNKRLPQRSCPVFCSRRSMRYCLMALSLSTTEIHRKPIGPAEKSISTGYCKGKHFYSKVWKKLRLTEPVQQNILHF